MGRYIILIFIIPFLTFGQSTKFTNTSDLTKIYSQSIVDFIKEANKRNRTTFDTLFIGKRKNGQPDDFPDIELPEILEKTHIRLISPEFGKVNQKVRKSRIYINMVGWVDTASAEFVFFVFSNGFEHQYNYSINYKYNIDKKQFKLTKLQFTGPPFDK